MQKPKKNYRKKWPILGKDFRLEDFRSNRMAIMNKDRQPHGFTVGQIVYMYNPSGGKLQTGSRKI